MAEVNVSEKNPNYTPHTPIVSTSFILFNLNGTRAHQPDFMTPKQIMTLYHDLFGNHYQCSGLLSPCTSHSPGSVHKTRFQG